MPMYMDIHDAPGATPDAVAAAHDADEKLQSKYGVVYHKYWMNEAQGKIFCLCTAPTAEAAMSVHREAHGLVAQKLVEVAPEVAEGFLGGCEVSPQGAALVPGAKNGERDTGIRTVFFTDIVGSTSLTQRIGDEKAMEVIALHDAVVRDAVAACGGREVKHTGDGIMASFVSAAGAVRAALQIHRALRDRFDGEDPLQVRIGAAAGEPVEANHDLFGSTVQLAARICEFAQPEQSVVSNAVAELCMGKGLSFTDLGRVTFKGFDQPVRVHAAL